MWYMISTAMLFVFSLPFFIVCFHSHATPVCNCIDKEPGTPSSKSPPNTAFRSSKLFKKVEDALGFGANKEIDDESSEESESSSSSSSILEKVKKKSKSKKKSRKAKSKSKKKRV